MSTRLYTRGQPTESFVSDPATERGSWDQVGYAPLRLSRFKSSNAPVVNDEVSSGAANFDMLHVKAVSDRLAAQTIQGTLQWVLGVGEALASMDTVFHVHAYVLREPDTLVGTLLADYIGTSEFPTTDAGKASEAPQTLSSVSCAEGDRIVIEVGCRVQAAVANAVNIYYNGTNATDLADGGDETVNPGWFEFSQNLLWSIDVVREVGETQSKTNPHTTLTVTVPASGVAAGNAILVAVATDDAAGTVSVADTAGNTYTTVSDGDLTNAGNCRVVLLAAFDVKALVSGNTVVVTHPSLVASACVVGEFAGVGGTVQGDTGGIGSATASGLSCWNALSGSDASLQVATVACEMPDESLASSTATIVGDIGTVGGGAASNMLAGLGFNIRTTTDNHGLGFSWANTRDFASVLSSFYRSGSPQLSHVDDPSVDLTDDAGIGSVAWTSPSFAGRPDDSRASVTLIAGQTSHYLKALDFRFDLPANAIVDGIQVDVECFQDLVLTQSMSCRLVKGGTVQTTQTKTFEVPSAEAYISFGGATDLWGLGWLVSDIEANNFGCAVWIDTATADTYRVDHIRVLVYYHLPTPYVGLPYGQLGQRQMAQLLSM